MEPFLTGLTTAVAFAIIVWVARFARRWFDAYRAIRSPARINEERASVGQPPLTKQGERKAKRKRWRRSLRSALLR